MHLFLHILRILFYLLNLLLALYFIMPPIFFLLHYLLPKKSFGKYSKQLTEKEFDFAAIITAHKDTRFIAPFVDSFIKQQYSNFIVYVVADDCDISDLHFTDERIVLLKPEKALNAKTQSIKFAVNNFVRPHDVLVIFDSDNLVHPEYLKNLNPYFQHGFRAVQTHMLSKNTDSVYARLDSIGHIYNNFLERQVKMELGLSSAILGLGIAIDSNLYNEIFYKDALGGFDKKLQIQLTQKLKQLGFAKDCIVYDEKVEDGAALEKQRTRWINTYFKYFRQSLSLFTGGLATFNLNQISTGLMMLRPPLFITFFAAFAFAIIGFVLKPVIGIVWCLLILLFAINFVLIIATQSLQKGMVQSLAYIPMIIIRQIKAVFKIKTANKNFLKTEHQNVIYIDELLNKERI